MISFRSAPYVLHGSFDLGVRTWLLSWPAVAFQQHRRYSSLPFVGAGNEVKTQVKLGIGRDFDVRIVYPPRPERNGPIILDLGCGIPSPAVRDHTHELLLGSNATLVRPAYHAVGANAYPAPVHMTLAIFDWITKNLVDSNHEASNAPNMGVLGELVGGSLAAMLALTECKPYKARITAAAIGNPILDWTDVFPFDWAMTGDDLKRQEGNNNASNTFSFDERTLSNPGLIAMRRVLFTKPDHFFDPFASPLLFFRTPCFDLPYRSPYPPLDDSKDTSGKEAAVVISRKRTYPRVYPPSNSGLRFPELKITLGREYALRHQGHELARQMQRGGRRLNRFPEYEASQERENMQAVSTEEKEGLGLWESRDALEVGQWLGEILRKR